jgi:hypothetical protein
MHGRAAHFFSGLRPFPGKTTVVFVLLLSNFAQLFPVSRKLHRIMLPPVSGNTNVSSQSSQSTVIAANCRATWVAAATRNSSSVLQFSGFTAAVALSSSVTSSNPRLDGLQVAYSRLFSVGPLPSCGSRIHWHILDFLTIFYSTTRAHRISCTLPGHSVEYSQLADECHAFLSGKQEQNSAEGRRRSHQHPL